MGNFVEVLTSPRGTRGHIAALELCEKKEMKTYLV